MVSEKADYTAETVTSAVVLSGLINGRCPCVVCKLNVIMYHLSRVLVSLLTCVS